jgi:hypothetical protein
LPVLAPGRAAREEAKLERPSFCWNLKRQETGLRPERAKDGHYSAPTELYNGGIEGVHASDGAAARGG